MPLLLGRAERLDNELTSDLIRIGGPKYAALAILAYRQTLAAHKLVADFDGKPLYFSKENFSKIKKFRTYSIITEVLATEIKKNNTITIYTYHHDSFSHNSIPPHTKDIYCLIFSALSPVRYCAKF